MRTARELSLASLEAVKLKQRDVWLSLFAEDATVEDPVGTSPLDPIGKGHHGIGAIGRFYDTIIAQNAAFDYRIREWHACGDEIASAATFSIEGSDGKIRDVNLIIIHKADRNGKICSLRAFWAFPGYGEASC